VGPKSNDKCPYKIHTEEKVFIRYIQRRSYRSRGWSEVATGFANTHRSWKMPRGFSREGGQPNNNLISNLCSPEL
jgi:hypothetical protein